MAILTTMTARLLALVGLTLIGCASSFQQPSASRRDFLSKGAAAAAFVVAVPLVPAALAADESLSVLLEQVKSARAQLEGVPKLIETEKWDGVRSILSKPPLSDCWTKSASPLLPRYADAIGQADGDELAALEGKEDAISHLRYLDMAAYNNIFNPIATEGTSGATKALVSSYYDDPTNEWKASMKAMDEIIELAGK